MAIPNFFINQEDYLTWFATLSPAEQANPENFIDVVEFENREVSTFYEGDGAIRNDRTVTIDAGNSLLFDNNAAGTEVVITDQITIEGGSPGVGKVLTSDANGKGTWESLSVGGISSLSSVDFSNLEDVTITSNISNYNPTNWLTKSGIRVTDLDNKDRYLYGLQAPTPGEWAAQIIYNDSPAKKRIRLRGESSSSDAENRFSLPNNYTNMYIYVNSFVLALYNPIKQRWHVMGLRV